MVKEGQEVEQVVMEGTKLVQPREHRAKVSIWGDLTMNDLDMLEEAITPDQIKVELSSIFHINDYLENKKSAILIDLYFYTLQFARDQGFSKEQASAFFTIVKRTHEVCVETPFGNVDQCFGYFREMVLCHAVKRPPYSIDLFSPEEVKKITDYVVNTYFRHYKLYKYVFTPLVRLDLTMTYEGMPPTPPPEEAEPEDLPPNDKSTETELAKEDAVPDTEAEPEGDQEAEPTQEGAGPEGAEATQETTDQPAQKEESGAASELRVLIKQHLEAEVKKLKQSMEEQIKVTEDTMNQRLAEVEGTTSPGRSGRTSGKGGKKKQ